MDTNITTMKNNKVYNILLLTNRDSDNVGDQVIEACDIGLVHTVMKNLELQPEQYKINSRSASIVTKKYIATKDASLLDNAESAIRDNDIIIFGGAPVFNYTYQTFYERTATTLELAQKYNKPVIFSAIGVESYDDKSPKCQRLKETLNFDCVKQITTRDGYERLTRYKEREDLIIGKVADPAVFASTVFKNYASEKCDKKIGLFVIRANGFKDNKIDFSQTDAANLWVELIHNLEQRGYDYELITSGHFGDEAFLDYLIRNYNVPVDKCIFNMNCPDKLIPKLSSYAGIISCRLHPSIISFSFNIPSVSLVWNNKVTGFYESMGYADRAISTQDITADTVIDKLEQAMKEGVSKDYEYLSTVYNTIFYGIKNILGIENDNLTPYNYDEIVSNMPAFKGTSKREQDLKLARKFRRTYSTCNDRFAKNEKLQNQIKDLNEQLAEANNYIEKLKNSKSHKLANAITYVPRKLKEAFKQS